MHFVCEGGGGGGLRGDQAMQPKSLLRNGGSLSLRRRVLGLGFGGLGF